MQQHKDLPAASQGWADEITAYREKIEALEGIVRRMVSDFGLDFANPQRGLNTDATPSVANPVMLKLPSLKDLDIRDAQDGDLLTFDGKRGVWTARRHDTVVLPKTFPQGDPASYYTPPAGVGTYAENLFVNPELRTVEATGVPKGFIEFYEPYPDAWTSVPQGDGTNRVRLTASGEDTFGSLTFRGGATGTQVVMDPTKSYVYSFDLIIPSPLPDFFVYMPFRVNKTGDSFLAPNAALSVGTQRVHTIFPPLTQWESAFEAALSINLDNGYAEFANFQITEVPVGFRRIAGNGFPTNETIDVSATCIPGKTYLVQDLCESDSPFSFALQAATPGGTVTLFSRNELQWPVGIVTIPADATSVSYSTVKPFDSWHNVNIAEVPSDYEFFEGGMPADVNYTYSWAGAANDSTSIRTPN